MKTLIAAHLLLLTLVACSGPAQRTPAVPEVSTQIATVTLAPSPASPSQTPAGQPAAAWNGIPIMPGAIAGEGDEEGYVFTLKATSQQVQEYYQLELGKLGWQLFAQENSDGSLLLSYMDSNAATLTVSILSKDEEVLVLLVK
ncbi:MAG TPA: hypothetical protein VFS61_10885 [Anaerolineales bacterium]|nr:hypothetical protein [Anaerolineales bacterium]